MLTHYVLLILLLILTALILLSLQGSRRSIHRKIRSLSKRKRAILLKSLGFDSTRAVVVGFFHPYCNAGGGGERVLWAAIRATQDEFSNSICVVYSGDINVSSDAIIKRAQDAFGITLDASRISIIPLKKRFMVSPEAWPHFTLIGQSLGSIILAYEAITSMAPDIFIDTMGYAFTYPLVSLLLGIPIACYTHYPTISTDMLSRVPSTNLAKLLYWRWFALLYSFVGRYADLVMANSTWTMNHLKQLWNLGNNQSRILYPPCDTKALTKLSISETRSKTIVCVAQFRKEKNHEILLKAFSIVKHASELGVKDETRLILIGTVRNDSDRERVENLRKLSVELQIDDHVDFRLDLPWPDVITVLGQAWIGTNAMWNEHFGIGVVEYMAAGLIAVVHDSAGPKLDIVTEYEGRSTGYHATDVQTFADAFNSALSLPDDECMSMRGRARESSKRFSEEVFEENWKTVMNSLMRLARRKKAV